MQEKRPTHELLSGRSESSVRLVYERYGRKLYLFAARKWNMKEDDAWDLVYKTLYRVIDTCPNYTFTSEQKFSAFVFTIFINYLRNFYRDRKHVPEEITLTDELYLSEPTTDPSNETVSPVMKLLQDELDLLEDWERILLLMRSQDAPYSQIAKFIGKPEDQLKVYYQRLKKKLSERMNEKLKTSTVNAHGNERK